MFFFDKVGKIFLIFCDANITWFTLFIKILINILIKMFDFVSCMCHIIFFFETIDAKIDLNKVIHPRHTLDLFYFFLKYDIDLQSLKIDKK